MLGVDEEHKSSSSEESDAEQEEDKDKPEDNPPSDDDSDGSDIEAAAARSALLRPLPGKTSRSSTPTEELKVNQNSHFYFFSITKLRITEENANTK